jgi:large conductance mechanosensitive channel
MELPVYLGRLMKAFLEEFKAFAVRGNVIDLAIAVVIGGAFGKIVSSLVDNIFMPVIGIVLGGVDFTKYTFTLGDVSITYGAFIQAVIDFVVIAFVIFLVIRALRRFEKKKEEVAPAGAPEEILLLREIRDAMKR